MRDRKPIVVDRVRSDGAEVEILYDFRERDFFFEEPGTRNRVHAETFVESRRRLLEIYEKAEPLDWKPVILVTLHEAYDDQDHSVRTKPVEGASVNLRFRRCELSPRPDRTEVVDRITHERERDDRLGRGSRDRGPIEREGCIEREHVLDFEAGNPSEYDREVRAKTLDRPQTYTNDADVVEMPYEEGTWRGLLALKTAIDVLHTNVYTFINRVDLRDRLKHFTTVGSMPLLGDGSDGSDGRRALEDAKKRTGP